MKLVAIVCACVAIVALLVLVARSRKDERDDLNKYASDDDERSIGGHG